MPGIVGLITKMPRERAEETLRKMVGTISHEPSYVTGTWVNAEMGVYVGWTSRKGSFADSMPIQNEDGNVCLVFSGEDFSEPGTASRLRSQGHTFEAEGPAYLAHLYEDDPEFLTHLNGRFHALLTDRQRGTATLFNDRYGMHRLYYHESQEAFYFACEAKAILKVRPELRKLDARGLGEFIACGCVLESRTLFDGIQVLPSASAWTFQNSTLQQRAAYFHPREWEDQELLQPEAFYGQLRSVFSQNLPRYFNGMERVGMSLTGGLDTRMIMAWHKSLPGSLPCYSFGSMFRDCQDVVMARRVAQACGQPHQVIPVGKEFLSRFPHYAERTVYLTDGCVEVSHSADLYVNEHAAKIAPIRMTGNYGGEVLRRVVAFKPVGPAPALFGGELLPHIQQAGATYDRILQQHPLSFALFRQAPWHHYGLLSLEQTQLTVRSPFLDNDFVRAVFRAPQSASTNNEISRRLIADGNTMLAQIRTDRGPMNGNHEWRSRAFRGFMDFTAKAEYAYDYGMPQWVAQVDHMFAPFRLERLFLGRHKFYHFRVWYRDFLASHVREMLLDPRTLSRPYLQRATVQNIVQGHLKGDHNYTSEIHKLLTLELISRLFLDSQ